ncbi:class I SAM-dependent methyltransferase [Inhella gelatinilytica]|uniref:class I SAM-dependent methyltransferase n=1 Tax=Inhella gelatinilytica TaxID=2795030 RepID=UPI002873C194|nr:methyltransferase domain-containing protein [Inhella gelatinilytica]
MESPRGRYLLAWEQARLDQAVADLFGFHAVQLGWPALEGLRANRMPNRWLADESAGDLHCSFDALPFSNDSLDLLVLPHTLETAPDPHHRLAEAARVLRPEGRLLLLGLNPASLWGLHPQQWRDNRATGRERIGYRRLRDWLRLLSFDVTQAQFGCYRPPWSRAPWLEAWQFMDRHGPTWWPVFGAVYFIQAVKRVHGMRLVGLARSGPGRRPAAAVALPSRSSREGIRKS